MTHIANCHKPQHDTLKAALKELADAKTNKKRSRDVDADSESHKDKKIRCEFSLTDLKEGCVELVTINGRPLSYIDDSGFQKIISPFVNSFNNSMAINSANIRQLVPETANKIRCNLKVEFKGRLVSLKVDSAKRLGRSILGKCVLT